MNQCISQSPCTLHFNYYFLCSVPPLPPPRFAFSIPARLLTFFCMLWPQFKNCSTNGKTNTRRERGKKLIVEPSEIPARERNVISRLHPNLRPRRLYYKYCITIICLASCELDFMLMQSPYRPLHMSSLTWAVVAPPTAPARWLFICFAFFYFCW